jgi:L-asparaginase II
MNGAVDLVEVWRGDLLESVHQGHAVIVGADGGVIEAWGKPETIVFPRSSSKMLQAMPLIESGAADTFGLTSSQLALACASHLGAKLHVNHVNRWLKDLGLTDDALRCGPEQSRDDQYRDEMTCSGDPVCQVHNNCSGKHSGFLTLNKHIGGGAEYIDPAHPIQVMVREATESLAGEDSAGYGIDGCSAPNFAMSLHGLGRAMAFYATAQERSDVRSKAAARLTDAMRMHPELVAGEGRTCTELMRATDGRVAIKTGAEGVFIAIVPEKKIGIALKIADGGTRASECVMASLLARVGVLDPHHPAARARIHAPIHNRRGIHAASVRPGAALA